ncbi:Cyclic pyranopterin monophosphate synthase [Rubripirellula lacrimiformis]|uniref:GTP 3',8-cyclase n=1 Tax=Rubripirellula lacrimiformis TaxID=1930273 RepID=A0A517NGU0_9BACT|nr:GTP 3',8-cyclase MoaA [Rubripirellula lacrimiformis]QDT06350.1 Cyclic pyranopterin monophosphate synthase [Rubripirellula lacrimiformis]
MTHSIPTPPSVRPLTDRFGRVHDSVRISVTDRCNIRCFYCMPEFGAQFVDKDRLLTFEEIHRLASLLVTQAGVRDIRITGGEPLVRRDLPKLIAMLAGIDGLEDISLTSNGILMADQAADLRAAGLRRVNISLDTLDVDVFRKITRRDGLDKTIAGIDAAITAGFDSVKLNALAIAGVTETEVERLIRFAIDRGVTLRFIEFMPLDADRSWTAERVLSGDELIAIIRDSFGDVEPIPRDHPSQPAEEFVVRGGRVGIIRSVTHPFCGDCNRIRITADGGIRNCLFASTETAIRDRMRSGASEDELLQTVRQCVMEKAAAHGIDEAGFRPPDRPMYSIGG